jgi:adenine-specific DNA glycosylase
MRVAQRLGYGEPAPHRLRSLRTTRQALLRESGRDPHTLRAVSQFFSHHGLTTCTEAAPHCTICPVATECAWVKLQ